MLINRVEMQLAMTHPVYRCGTQWYQFIRAGCVFLSNYIPTLSIPNVELIKYDFMNDFMMNRISELMLLIST